MPPVTIYPTPTTGPSNIRIAMVDDNEVVHKTLLASLKLSWPGAWFDPYIDASGAIPTGVPKSLDEAVRRVKKFKPHILFVDWNLSGRDEPLAPLAPLETHGVNIDAKLDALVMAQSNSEDKEWFQDYPMLIHFTANRWQPPMAKHQANARLDAGGLRRMRRAEVLEKFMIGRVEDKPLAENLWRVLLDYKADPRIKRFLEIDATDGKNKLLIQLEDIAHLNSHNGKYVVVTKKDGSQARIAGSLKDFGPNVMLDGERGYFMKAGRSCDCLINMQSVKGIEWSRDPGGGGKAHFNDGTVGPGPIALFQSDVLAIVAAESKLGSRGIPVTWIGPKPPRHSP